MTYSTDFRWRVVFLMHVYGVSVQYVSHIFGPKPRYSLFLTMGVSDSHHNVGVTCRGSAARGAVCERESYVLPGRAASLPK